MRFSRIAAAFIAATIVLSVIVFSGSYTDTPTEPAATQGAYMVSAAHPEAARAGREILAAGGSAVDAAIAVQLVLTLVEPQSSGIGGGAYMLHWKDGDRQLTVYDGRETAPTGATPELFLDEAGKPHSFFDSVVTGQSVGVPGVVAMLHLAHEEQGTLPWARLFEPALRLAEDGFTLSPRLNMWIDWSPALPNLPWSRAYFFTETEDGEAVPLAAGTLLRNPAYATTLRLLAEQGPEAFYKGDIAKAIVAMVQNAPTRPGTLSLADMAAYKAIKREPLCLAYRVYSVCGMPPSSSGGLTSLQILGILENFEMGNLEPGSLEAVHLITEASRLAYADRDLYIGDPGFVDVPAAAMLDESYLASRARTISTQSSMGPANAGRPAATDQAGALRNSPYAPNVSRARPSTSHFSIVDGQGNVVSMTTSVEAPFGSHLMVGGFFLNNQLTDFSFLPVVDGKPVANAVAPGKRPRSSMSPTLVFDEEGEFYAAVGSPGGSRIIAYVAQTLIGLLDHGLTMQAAIDQPRHVTRNGPLEIEAGTALVELEEALRALGHQVSVGPITSGLHGIRRTANGLEGGADPRREGVVLSGP